MSHTSTINLLLCVLLFSAVPLPAGRTQGGSLQNSADATSATPSAKKIDVCALLTSAEIQAVQGEPIKETKPSAQPSGGFLTSQCYFRTATAAKSVSVALATPDPTKPSALSPREFWRKQFNPAEELKDKEKPAAGKAPTKSEPEDEKEVLKPRVIARLGEEAYWVGNSITGALYVLKGEVFLRISVGGVRDASERIEKSKALAHAALKRL
jgi:hypothetical protein